MFYKEIFMAERRMFAKTIVTSDAFLDMPLSARCLYFTLGMFADDDGFVNAPKSIMRQIGASMDDLNILLAKRFVIGFESGIIVIKHWRINNYLRSDRYNETKYLQEKAMLSIDDNGAYSIGDESWYTDGIPSIVKVSKVEGSKEKVSVGKGNGTPDNSKNQPLQSNNEVTKCNEASNCLFFHDKVLSIVKEECPTCYNRYQRKIDSGKLDCANKLNQLLEELQGQYDYEALRKLFRHANKTYVVSPNYQQLDLLWVLSNIEKVKAIEERGDYSGGGQPNQAPTPTSLPKQVTAKTADELMSDDALYLLEHTEDI